MAGPCLAAAPTMQASQFTDTFMTTLLLDRSDLPGQRALARRFLWRSTWPNLLIAAGAGGMLVDALARSLPAGAGFGPDLAGLAGIALVPLAAFIQAWRQLAALRDGGGVLTADLVSTAPVAHFVSPLDPFATFELCADRLSSVGMANALGFAGPAAYCHNPFKGEMTIGRVRPFWRDGALRVTIVQSGSSATRVEVRRIPGAWRYVPKLGAALAMVELVCAELTRTVHARRAALDAAVRAQALERAALQSTLHVLQAQVEPHFLYNTLANLKHLIRTDGPRAQAMVDHLVGYLQAALPDMRSASTTVARELALAGHYLHLMQIRMGERLHFVIDADPAVTACAMPPAMLVSLLENAVKHGLEGATRPGTITVTAQCVAGLLELSVSDDGAGLTHAQAGAGLGLANLHQRLHLLYGADAALLVAPGASSGVLATLRLPMREGD